MDETPGHSFLEDIQSTHDVSGMRVSDVLGQAGQLITVSGLAFGFLLSLAVTHVFERYLGHVLIAFALMCTASAIIIFLLPLLYIQLHFPIDKKQILHFYVWSHRFILCGIVLLITGIYSAVCVALYRLIDWPAFIVATGILILPLTVYRLRGIGGPIELM